MHQPLCNLITYGQERSRANAANAEGVGDPRPEAERPHVRLPQDRSAFEEGLARTGRAEALPLPTDVCCGGSRSGVTGPRPLPEPYKLHRAHGLTPRLRDSWDRNVFNAFRRLGLNRAGMVLV